MGLAGTENHDRLREFFFAIIESLPGGILLADPQGNLQAANRKASRLLGLDGSALQNRSCWELLSSRFDLADRESTLHLPGGRLLLEHGGDQAQPERRYLLISRNELQSPFLHVTGFLLSIEDVTFPALIEAQLDRRKRFAAMREMAEAVSQELKNPLGSLALYASILKREFADDPDTERVTTRMLGAVRTINHLLNNFVTFSAFPLPEMQELDILVLLESSIASLKETADEHGIGIISRFEINQAPMQGDPALLAQLFLNLGLNGLESMISGGSLVWGLRRLPADREHGPLLEITVRDEGCGISRENLPKIFDPFFSTKSGRRGLGLAICHQIAETHNGLIEVESRPGEGSTFRVLFPAG